MGLHFNSKFISLEYTVKTNYLVGLHFKNKKFIRKNILKKQNIWWD